MELGVHFIDFLSGEPDRLAPRHWRRRPRPPKKPARRCSRSPTTSFKWKDSGGQKIRFSRATRLGFLAAKTRSINLTLLDSSKESLTPKSGTSFPASATRRVEALPLGLDLRGQLERLTPTLPGAGRRSNEARSAANGRVGGVAGTATVVTVVVKTVVRSGLRRVSAVPADPGRHRSESPSHRGVVTASCWAAGSWALVEQRA